MLRVAEEAIRRGYPDQAVIAYQKAAARFREMGQRVKEIAVLQNLIRLQPDAVEPLRQLVEVYDEIGRRQEAAGARVRLAAALRQRGDNTEAAQLEREAHALAFNLDDERSDPVDDQNSTPEMPGDPVAIGDVEDEDDSIPFEVDLDFAPQPEPAAPAPAHSRAAASGPPRPATTVPPPTTPAGVPKTRAIPRLIHEHPAELDDAFNQMFGQEPTSEVPVGDIRPRSGEVPVGDVRPRSSEVPVSDVRPRSKAARRVSGTVPRASVLNVPPKSSASTRRPAGAPPKARAPHSSSVPTDPGAGLDDTSDLPPHSEFDSAGTQEMRTFDAQGEFSDVAPTPAVPAPPSGRVQPWSSDETAALSAALVAADLRLEDELGLSPFDDDEFESIREAEATLAMPTADPDVAHEMFRRVGMPEVGMPEVGMPENVTMALDDDSQDTDAAPIPESPRSGFAVEATIMEGRPAALREDSSIHDFEDHPAHEQTRAYNRDEIEELQHLLNDGR